MVLSETSDSGQFSRKLVKKPILERVDEGGGGGAGASVDGVSTNDVSFGAGGEPWG